jgi:MFS family permease
MGVVETCWYVFSLLVAIRVFHADDYIKQFIPAGLGVGLLLSPIGLSIINHLNLRISTVLAGLWVLCAFAFAGMALSPSIVIFVVFVAALQILASQGVPLLTHLYSTNYPADKRGSWLSNTFIAGSLLAIGFGLAGGKLLDYNVDYYPLIFVLGIFAALLIAFGLYRIPSDKTSTLKSRHPIQSLSDAWSDHLFRKMLIGWMMIGMGNLMMIPLRLEYLANPIYGINASNFQVTVLMTFIVLTFRVLSTKVWGVLFDRMNVITLRIILNMVFLFSILFFFYASNLWVIGFGCALLGMAFGGGGILWTLYVTKIAPPEKVSTYMSVHGFLTGIRMALAPFIGYAVLHYAHPVLAAWISISLIGLSSIIFLPLRELINAKAGELESFPTQPGTQA